MDRVSLSRVGSLAAIAVLALAFGASPASARCKSHAGMLASKFGNTIWHTGSTLYGCEGQNAASFPQVKLGRWAPGSILRLDFSLVAWTLPGGSGSGRYDRINVTNIAIGSTWTSWLHNKRAVPAHASSPAHDARVQRLTANEFGVAWVTTAGDVVMALDDPARRPQPIGDLTSTLKPQGRLLLVGSWRRGSADDLARSAKLTFKQAQSACSGSDQYSLTVVPPGGSHRVGARWFDKLKTDCP